MKWGWKFSKVDEEDSPNTSTKIIWHGGSTRKLKKKYMEEANGEEKV